MNNEWIIATAGGGLIGAAALILYASSGRIAGISGISYGLLSGAADRDWRWLFLASLLVGGWLAAHALGSSMLTAPALSPDVSLHLMGAGLLVGIGTRLGNGCTSGHGVCGLARLSPRSLVAVAVFMMAGMLVATLLPPIW